MNFDKLSYHNRQAQLPKDWKIKKLGELCNIIGGGTPSKSKKEFYTGTIPWATVRDMKSSILNSTEFKITKEAVKSSSTNIISSGNVVIATRVGLGKVCLLKKDTAINQDLKGVIPHHQSELSIKYLFLWFESIKKFLIDSGRGMTVHGIKLDFVKSIPFPLPPLPEQKRIVSILDRAFAAIDQAKANYERCLSLSKGLFESYLQGVFENKGKGWEEKRFEEVCVLQRGFDLPTRLRFVGDYPLVSSNGITDRINQWKVKAPGVVTGRSGTIGNVHFIEEDFWPLNTALYIKDFRGNYERCIYYFLLKFDLSRYSSGAGVPTLNRNNVHSEKVWFPNSISEQKDIVQKLDTLKVETQKLETLYQKKIDALEELKKSILQKAMAGELVESQGELRSGEPVESEIEKAVGIE